MGSWWDADQDVDNHHLLDDNGVDDAELVFYY